jgi:hypothetical protein
MGWCSATPIFDKVAHFVLKTDAPDDEKYEVLYVLADALENEDWDCQSDSDFFEHAIVQRIFKELHPDWEWEDEDD